MEKISKWDDSLPYSKSLKSLWLQNHATMLFVFGFAVFLIGSGILFYRQHMFVPPRFPGASSFSNSMDPQTPVSDLLADHVIFAVAGAANERGEMRLAIYDAPEGFNNTLKAIRRLSTNIQLGGAVFPVKVSTLPEEFAVAVFHDEDANGNVSVNQYGIPSERYGFSRNARGDVGPPSYEDAIIKRPEAGTTITISIR